MNLSKVAVEILQSCFGSLFSSDISEGILLYVLNGVFLLFSFGITLIGMEVSKYANIVGAICLPLLSFTLPGILLWGVREEMSVRDVSIIVFLELLGVFFVGSGVINIIK